MATASDDDKQQSFATAVLPSRANTETEVNHGHDSKNTASTETDVLV
jgi:hypothetical protein